MAVENPKVETFQGNRHVLHFDVKDEDGNALNLTGFSAKWAASEYFDGKPKLTPAVERKSSAGEITIAASAGGVDVILAEGVTMNLEGLYYYELEVFDGSANSCVVATGDLEVKRNLTNT